MILSIIRKSIFRRLLISYLFTVLLGLCAVGLLVSFFTNDYIEKSKKDEMFRKARKVNFMLQQSDHLDDVDKQLLLFFDQSFDARIWVFDRSGKVLATSSQDEVSLGKEVDSAVVREVTAGKSAVVKTKDEDAAQPVLSVVVPWGKDDQVFGGILLQAPMNGMQETIVTLRETILWATLGGILLSTVVVSIVSWSISRPLQKIDRAASRISMGHYSERIPIEADDEIGELAATINQMAEKLEQVDYERMESEKTRSDFLGNVSHELRTPLTAMQGFLEALQDDLIEESAKPKYYDIMYNETMYMSRLVDDLMDLIKLERGDIHLSRVPFDVGPLLHKAAFTFAGEAEEKGNTIQVWVEDGIPQVLADYDRLEQILNNLIKNAVKFTDNGTITLQAGQEHTYIRLSVSDTGRGIAEADRELVWERFYKANRGRSRSDKGTGLGLAIVKELVKRQDGEIRMESVLSQGTTFTLLLPSVDSELQGADKGESSHENRK